MIRELFHIGSFSITPFGVMMMLAFLAAYWQLAWGVERLGAGDRDDAAALLLAAGFGGLIGAKLYYAILYGDISLLFDRAGLVWYGGFLLGAAAVLWTMWRRRMPPWRTADAVAPALALGYALGRVGCFLVGDDYGLPSELPWAVAFPVGLPPTTAGAMRRAFGVDIPPGVPADRLLTVHPTQIYESLAALAIWGVGLWLIRRAGRPGTVVFPMLALLAVERFAVEFVRAKDDRFLGELTLAQAISLGVLLIIVVWFWYRRASPSDSDSTAPVQSS